MARVYDKSALNPKGIPEDPTLCIEEVPWWNGWHSYQCSRKRKVGLYCKQHAKKHADPNKGWGEPAPLSTGPAVDNSEER